MFKALLCAGVIVIYSLPSAAQRLSIDQLIKASNQSIETNNDFLATAGYVLSETQHKGSSETIQIVRWAYPEGATENDKSGALDIIYQINKSTGNLGSVRGVDLQFFDKKTLDFIKNDIAVKKMTKVKVCTNSNGLATLYSGAVYSVVLIVRPMLNIGINANYYQVSVLRNETVKYVWPCH